MCKIVKELELINNKLRTGENLLDIYKEYDKYNFYDFQIFYINYIFFKNADIFNKIGLSDFYKSLENYSLVYVVKEYDDLIRENYFSEIEILFEKIEKDIIGI